MQWCGYIVTPQPWKSSNLIEPFTTQVFLVSESRSSQNCTILLYFCERRLLQAIQVAFPFRLECVISKTLGYSRLKKKNVLYLTNADHIITTFGIPWWNIQQVWLQIKTTINWRLIITIMVKFIIIIILGAIILHNYIRLFQNVVYGKQRWLQHKFFY